MMAKILLPSTTALRTQAAYATAPRRSQAMGDRCIGLLILGKVCFPTRKDQIAGMNDADQAAGLAVGQPPKNEA
jgi:hypothetical protein